MYPTISFLNSWNLSSWFACFILANLAGIELFRYLNSRARIISWKDFQRLFLICYGFGLFGARTISWVFEAQESSLLGAMTLYGAIIFAAPFAILFLHKQQLKIQPIANLLTPSLCLGISIGRIGCFLNGDDFGKTASELNLPEIFFVSFPNHQDIIPRLPTQLLESFTCLILTIIAIKKWLLHHQNVAFATGCTYAFCRICIECLRGDERPLIIHESVSLTQGISGSILALAVSYLALKKAKNSLRQKREQANDEKQQKKFPGQKPRQRINLA